ncbi:hypothetical protein [Desulfitobacterium sp.]|uniref:hypothetical protein n=1 Tax=Desulfitobacterium sp. TaxID=49981 RepID=UPI002B21E737|nr:hypothetical protein [Desulfitobacterium sp.]MEA4903159.1 hypothetical protein [Desulfitobacterium sp.]
MELNKICQNCNSFFQDIKELDIDFGVCLMDSAFEPFMDEVVENADFSCCRELYLKKRFDGAREVCENYEEIEVVDISDDEDINPYIHSEKMKHQNVDEVIKYFYDADNTIVNNAISTISMYVHIGNEKAYKGLIDYYVSLGPAESLEDVYLRLKIVDILTSKESEKNTIKAYVNELARTPSNNTTRQLYTEILKRLSRCPSEMVQEPLMDLLEKKKFSYKIKNRIMEAARIRKADENWYK